MVKSLVRVGFASRRAREKTHPRRRRAWHGVEKQLILFTPSLPPLSAHSNLERQQRASLRERGACFVHIHHLKITTVNIPHERRDGPQQNTAKKKKSQTRKPGQRGGEEQLNSQRVRRQVLRSSSAVQADWHLEVVLVIRHAQVPRLV